MYRILQGKWRICGVVFVRLHYMFLGIGRNDSCVQAVIWFVMEKATRGRRRTRKINELDFMKLF